MYELYIANKNYSSWSLRPWLLMSELELRFEEHLIRFGDGAAWSAYRRRSPSGKVPCLFDGDIRVWDSLSIVEYLGERHPGVWPQQAPARAWARSAAAEMHSGFGELRSRCSMSCGVRVRLHEPGMGHEPGTGRSAGLEQDLARLTALWLEGLRRFGGPFLAGERFTAVDAFFAPVAFRIQTFGLALDASADEYARRLLQLPGMQRWYVAALAEPWRDAAHDAEVLANGTLLQDQRRTDPQGRT